MAAVSPSLDRRRAAHELVAARLAAMSADRLAEELASISWRASVHGSQTGVIDFGDAKVFVKQIALTDIESTADPKARTANLFDLPLFYQYGVGSAGFGAWRELRASLQASEWALSGEWAHFPLVHHWRVLPRTQPVLSEWQIAWLKSAPDQWDRAPAVRARLEALSAASASIVLFVEYLPQALHDWLRDRSSVALADGTPEAAILRFHNQWRDTAAFMNDRGMFHFDLNASNLLTDGEHLYVADFGLALCADFNLSPQEKAFLEAHRLYDRSYVDWAFIDWVVTVKAEKRHLASALAARFAQCAPVAEVFGDFLSRLVKESKSAPYPADLLQAALNAQNMR